MDEAASETVEAARKIRMDKTPWRTNGRAS
jgi:hypothetical protein